MVKAFFDTCVAIHMCSILIQYIRKQKMHLIPILNIIGLLMLLMNLIIGIMRKLLIFQSLLGI